MRRNDAKRREVLALSAAGDPVEAAIVRAIDRASEAGRFDALLDPLDAEPRTAVE